MRLTQGKASYLFTSIWHFYRQKVVLLIRNSTQAHIFLSNSWSSYHRSKSLLKRKKISQSPGTYSGIRPQLLRCLKSTPQNSPTMLFLLLYVNLVKLCEKKVLKYSTCCFPSCREIYRYVQDCKTSRGLDVSLVTRKRQAFKTNAILLHLNMVVSGT